MPPTSARECLHEPAPNSGLPPEVLIEVVLKPREGSPLVNSNALPVIFSKIPM
jgi:hypothetical protein